MIHNEYTQENPRTNRQDRQKITFHESANPKQISQQCTPTTHTEAVHCQGVLLGVFHPCLWPLKAPGSTLGEGRQTSRQITDATVLHRLRNDLLCVKWDVKLYHTIPYHTIRQYSKYPKDIWSRNETVRKCLRIKKLFTGKMNLEQKKRIKECLVWSVAV